MLSQAELDELWDFGDLTGSSQRLIDAVRARQDDAERVELFTQVARAMGLAGDFASGHEWLDTAAGSDSAADAAVATRIELERGRLFGSAKDLRSALAHFEKAARLAADADLTFLEVDALHMAAIVDDDPEWISRALAAIETTTDDRTRRWSVSLWNNLGHTLATKGERTGARFAFLQAEAAADRWGTPEQQQRAREALTELDSRTTPPTSPE